MWTLNRMQNKNYTQRKPNTTDNNQLTKTVVTVIPCIIELCEISRTYIYYMAHRHISQ